MSFEPLLEVQRDLYSVPPGPGRFKRYLEVMTAGGDDMALPLAVMNPMGKAQVLEKLESLLAAGAERVAEAAVAEAKRRLGPPPEPLRLGLVMADDAQGGWTNRYSTGFEHDFHNRAELVRGWQSVLLWTGASYDEKKLKVAVLASLYRAYHQLVRGSPRTLAQTMRLQGFALAFAGAEGPGLESDDLAAIRKVIAPYLASELRPHLLTCLYGDEAANSLGYPPLGLPPFAGEALALAEARAAPEDPISVLGIVER